VLCSFKDKAYIYGTSEDQKNGFYQGSKGLLYDQRRKTDIALSANHSKVNDQVAAARVLVAETKKAEKDSALAQVLSLPELLSKENLLADTLETPEALARRARPGRILCNDVEGFKDHLGTPIPPFYSWEDFDKWRLEFVTMLLEHGADPDVSVTVTTGPPRQSLPALEAVLLDTATLEDAKGSTRRWSPPEATEGAEAYNLSVAKALIDSGADTSQSSELVRKLLQHFASNLDAKGTVERLKAVLSQ